MSCGPIQAKRARRPVTNAVQQVSLVTRSAVGTVRTFSATRAVLLGGARKLTRSPAVKQGEAVVGGAPLANCISRAKRAVWQRRAAISLAGDTIAVVDKAIASRAACARHRIAATRALEVDLLRGANKLAQCLGRATGQLVSISTSVADSAVRTVQTVGVQLKSGALEGTIGGVLLYFQSVA